MLNLYLSVRLPFPPLEMEKSLHHSLHYLLLVQLAHILCLLGLGEVVGRDHLTDSIEHSLNLRQDMLEEGSRLGVEMTSTLSAGAHILLADTCVLS